MKRMSMKTFKWMRLHQQERTLLELTEKICRIMEWQNVSRSKLAKRLGCTEKHVTQLLDGRASMSIRMVSDIFTALNHTIHFREGNRIPPDPELQTTKCISCGKTAYTWTGHVRKRNGQKVLAGWCSSLQCYKKVQSDSKGCYGRFKRSFGEGIIEG